MVRIGIDSGSGGLHGPVFHDGSFEFVPIPDRFGIDERTYGNTSGLKQRNLVEYFPESRREAMAAQSIHFDPEFATFTYGDPTPPKSGLRRLEKGDMLILGLIYLSTYLPSGRLSKPFSARTSATSSMCRQSPMQA